MHDCGFRRLRKIYKNLFTVETVESSNQQSEKSRFRLRVFYKSVSQWRHKIEGEGLECIKNGLNFHMHLSQVFYVLFTAVSVIMCKTPRLFYEILLFLAWVFLGGSCFWKYIGWLQLQEK